jgi:hypothetical protein
MMKKGLLVLLLAGLLAGSAFAQLQLSAGGGAYITGDFGGGVEASMGGANMSIETPYFGGGAFGFLDAKYAEFSMGLFGAGGTTTIEMTGLQTMEYDFSVVGLDIAVIGKRSGQRGCKLVR